MATRKATATPVAPQPARELFSINGRYTIAPETTSAQLTDDIPCLLECAKAIVETVLDAANDPGGQVYSNPGQVARMLFGASYLLEMVQSMNLHVEVKA